MYLVEGNIKYSEVEEHWQAHSEGGTVFVCGWDGKKISYNDLRQMVKMCKILRHEPTREAMFKKKGEEINARRKKEGLPPI